MSTKLNLTGENQLATDGKGMRLSAREVPLRARTSKNKCAAPEKSGAAHSYLSGGDERSRTAE
jgi:hypothetical protein